MSRIFRPAVSVAALQLEDAVIATLASAPPQLLDLTIVFSAQAAQVVESIQRTRFRHRGTRDDMVYDSRLFSAVCNRALVAIEG